MRACDAAAARVHALDVVAMTPDVRHGLQVGGLKGAVESRIRVLDRHAIVMQGGGDLVSQARSERVVFGGHGVVEPRFQRGDGGLSCARPLVRLDSPEHPVPDADASASAKLRQRRLARLFPGRTIVDIEGRARPRLPSASVPCRPSERRRSRDAATRLQRRPPRRLRTRASRKATHHGRQACATFRSQPRRASRSSASAAEQRGGFGFVEQRL